MNKSTIFRVFFLASVNLALCEHLRASEGTDARQEQAQQTGETKKIMASLVAMPDWTSFPVFNDDRHEDRKRIERTIAKIAMSDLDTIRRAEVLFTKAQETEPMITTEAKLFILNNYLFNLPMSISINSPQYGVFGGYLGVPHTGDARKPIPSDKVNLMWPWSKDKRGVLQLTGRFSGYLGPDYEPLEAFDFYRKNFERRAIGDSSDPFRGTHEESIIRSPERGKEKRKE